MWVSAADLMVASNGAACLREPSVLRRQRIEVVYALLCVVEEVSTMTNDTRDAQQLEDLSDSQLANVTGGRADRIPPPHLPLHLSTQKFENSLPGGRIKPSGHGRGPGRAL